MGVLLAFWGKSKVSSTMRKALFSLITNVRNICSLIGREEHSISRIALELSELKFDLCSSKK